MTVNILAELLRADGSGGQLPWVLVADLENPATSRSDPVIDYGVRTRLDALDTLLTQIEGNTDGLEGFTDQLEALLTTLHGYVDGLEAGIGATIDAESAAGDGSLIAIAKNLRTRLASIQATLAAGVAVTGPLTDMQLRATPVDVAEQNQLIPAAFDFIDLAYTGDDLTSVVYKSGGAGGTVEATLTLVYAGGNLDTITRT